MKEFRALVKSAKDKRKTLGAMYPHIHRLIEKHHFTLYWKIEDLDRIVNDKEDVEPHKVEYYDPKYNMEEIEICMYSSERFVVDSDWPMAYVNVVATTLKEALYLAYKCIRHFYKGEEYIKQYISDYLYPTDKIVDKAFPYFKYLSGQNLFCVTWGDCENDFETPLKISDLPEPTHIKQYDPEDYNDFEVIQRTLMYGESFYQNPKCIDVIVSATDEQHAILVAKLMFQYCYRPKKFNDSNLSQINISKIRYR